MLVRLTRTGGWLRRGPHSGPLSVSLRQWAVRAGAAAGVGFLGVALPGFAKGGYSERSWGWLVLGFAAVVGLALLFRTGLTVSPLEVFVLVALLALLVWTLVSGQWGIPGTESLREAGLVVVYLAGLCAFAAVIRSASVRPFLCGVLAAVVALALYGFGDRFASGSAPDPLQGSLLAEPLGYANALGILCAIGLVIAIGMLVRERRTWAVLVLITAAVVLTVALRLTESRGAWLAVACGLVVVAAFSPLPRWAWVLGLAALAAAALVLVLSSHAGLGERPAYWRVAVHDIERHPVLGSGAGTFDDYWYAHRPDVTFARDAHSLYLETVAELGPLGLVLLLAVLLPPLAAAVAARSHPATAIAAGGYVAFLVHAGLDWDWEMPATTLAGLACAAVLFAAARSRATGADRRGAARWHSRAAAAPARPRA